MPLEPSSWGDSAYVELRLTGTVRLADALNHLFVTLPVLDDAKHYWVSTDEVDKLVTAGSGWLAGHPEKELITSRYLARQRALTDAALARLAESDDLDPAELDNAVPDLAPGAEPRAETAPQPEAGRPASLAVLRRQAVLGVLREAGARTVADLGCGEGTLTGDLLNDSGFTRVIATDVSTRALAQAARRLRLDQLPDARRERLTMFQSSLTYRDARLAGLDAAVLMEVIEHVEPDRLSALERAVFGFGAARTVVVTTPNREYNPEYGMADGRAPAPRPPVRVGPRAVHVLGFPRRRGLRLRCAVRGSGAGIADGRFADPAGRVHPRRQGLEVPREQGAFHPRAVARGACRRDRIGQVDVRPRSTSSRPR